MSTPDEQVYYAHRSERNGEVKYFHASLSRWWIELFGFSDPIVRVRLRERLPSDPPSSYYGWICAMRPDRYEFVWPSETQFNTCFQNGPDHEQARGNGRKVNLVIEEIAEVEG